MFLTLISTEYNVIISLWNFGALQYFKVIIININSICVIYKQGKNRYAYSTPIYWIPTIYMLGNTMVIKIDIF